MKIKVSKSLIFGYLLVLLIIIGACNKSEVTEVDNIKEENSGKIDEETAQKITKLLSLPYIGYVKNDPDPMLLGVTEYNREQAYKGVNIYISRNKRGAHLVDMEGEILHSWKPKEEDNENWLYAEMDNEGNLIVLVRLEYLMKLNWDSNIKWICNGIFHHDFGVAENGNIYVLGKKIVYVPYSTNNIPIQDNFITVLNPEGKLIQRISLFGFFEEILRKEKYKLQDIHEKINIQKLPLENVKSIDVFHTNTLEIIERDIGIFKSGDILLCIRNLNLIVAINLTKKEITWSWGEKVLDYPHHPTILDNGNILVFDNGRKRKYSRVLEYDPMLDNIVWEYKGNPLDSFFSNSRGGNQRLPNGNTLITESDKGHVFEVNPEGKIVWEFWNYDFDEDGKRMVIYRMMRLEPPRKLKNLKK